MPPRPSSTCSNVDSMNETMTAPVRTNGEVLLKGIAAAPGIAIGPAYVYSKEVPIVEMKEIDASEVEAEIAAAFRVASGVVKGFAVGRTIFADAAKNWLSGKITDEQAVADMAARFERLVHHWENVHVETARKAAR